MAGKGPFTSAGHSKTRETLRTAATSCLFTPSAAAEFWNFPKSNFSTRLQSSGALRMRKVHEAEVGEMYLPPVARRWSPVRALDAHTWKSACGRESRT